MIRPESEYWHVSTFGNMRSSSSCNRMIIFFTMIIPFVLGTKVGSKHERVKGFLILGTFSFLNELKQM